MQFLTREWIQALDAAARSNPELAAATGGIHLEVEHEVVGAPQGTVRYHVAIHDGTVRVGEGPAPAATVRFSSDHATALDIAVGRGSAQRAFMTGRLRVGGDMAAVLEHGPALASLDDVFAPVRARLVHEASLTPAGGDA